MMVRSGRLRRAAVLAVVVLLSVGVAAESAVAKLTISSPVMTAGGTLPLRFTCDGAGISPPIRWASPPAGTRSFAVVMHTIAGPARPGDSAGDSIHAYLIRYALPAATRSLAAGQTTVGAFGVSTVNEQEAYSPPCSQGPGLKEYTITVYALKRAPTFAAGTSVTRPVLLAAIKPLRLGSAAMTVGYERSTA